MQRHNPGSISQEAADRLLDPTNRDLFILHYFSHRIQKLEDFHLRLIDNAVRKERGLTLYPAGHGKTTITSTLLPIAELCANPDVRMAIIGKNDDEAKAIMRVIQAELTTNEQLIRDFGPFWSEGKEKQWALQAMNVEKRQKRAKESTIRVFGSGAKTVLGYRTDWTICDDVVTEKNSSSPTQRQNIRDWFDLAVETGPEFENSRLTVVGTLFDPEDLYHDLIDLIDPEDGLPIWHVQREDAVVDEDERLTLWPVRWPWKRLMRQKAKVGTLNFNKRYRNIAVDPSRMVFREEYLRGGYIGKFKYPGCIDRGHRIGSFDQTWRTAAGFDPAVGLQRNAKFCAHIVLARGSCLRHPVCYWVIDLKRDQMTLPQQADLILKQHADYHLDTSIVEANSYQGGLLQLIEERMAERGDTVRVEPHYTTRTNKPDPESGVQAMAPAFEKGEIHIPWSDDYDRRVMSQFVTELIQYPGRYSDTVMAFWFAWKKLHVSAPKYDSYNRLKKTAPMWSKRLGRRVVQNPWYVKDEPELPELEVA